MSIVGGIFVGGRARRMGGVAKGLLRTKGNETIVTHHRRMFDALGIPCVLVGVRSAYRGEGLAMLPDDPRSEGPLAGLLSLLDFARGGTAIAIACDMPFVTIDLLERLAEAPPAAIVAARHARGWEPFFARYDAGRVLAPALGLAHDGHARLQMLFERVRATPFVLTGAEGRELDDWDTPEDASVAWDARVGCAS